MEVIKAATLIKILSSSTSKKIGILDNNTISFLSKIDKYIYIEKILMNYDLILIPSWVYEEVKDSKEREDYLENLLNKNIQINIINEKEYEELARYKSVWLYKFFLYSSFLVGELKSYIKRNIEKNKPLDELDDYDNWIKLLYENGFDGKTLKNGRIKKKNAGEISISVLALIMSYTYFQENHNITVISNDRDTYEFIKFAKQKLLQDNMFKKLESSVITFKSNDFLIKECYQNNSIKEGHNLYSILEFRDEKRTKYTINALDSSVEEHDKILNNKDFIESLKDKTFNIIF